MKRLSMLVALVLAMTALTGVGGASAAAPYCGIRWGSLLKQAPITDTAPMTGVRAGRHACFDRLVIDVRGKADGYWVGYAEGTWRHEGVELRGGAKLSVVVVTPAYDDDYRPTYRPRNPAELVDVTGWRTFRQIVFSESYEGQTALGLGVRARLPFRVFTLDGPGNGSRIVVDVAHRW